MVVYSTARWSRSLHTTEQKVDTALRQDSKGSLLSLCLNVISFWLPLLGALPDQNLYIMSKSILISSNEDPTPRTATTVGISAWSNCGDPVTLYYPSGFYIVIPCDSSGGHKGNLSGNVIWIAIPAWWRWFLRVPQDVVRFVCGVRVRMVASSSELLRSPSYHNSTHSIGQETKMKIASLIKIYLFLLRTSRTGEITTIWVSLDSLLPRLRARLHPSLDFHSPLFYPVVQDGVWGL